MEKEGKKIDFNKKLFAKRAKFLLVSSFLLSQVLLYYTYINIVKLRMKNIGEILP